MRLYSLILLPISCCLVIALSPGSEIKIAQHGIDSAVQSFIDYFYKSFQSFNFKDIHKKYFDITDIVVYQLDFDSKNAEIKLKPNGEIWANVVGVSARAKAKFRAHWSIFHTSGSIKATTDGAAISLKLAVVDEKGQPRIVNRGTDVDLGDWDISVHGSIVSWILDMLIEILNGYLDKPFRKSLIKLIDDEIEKLSNKVVGIATQKALEGKLEGVYVGYGLTSDPTVADAALTIPTETQFWYKDYNNKGPVKSSGPFPFGAPSQMVCADIDADLVFGTASYAFDVSGKGTFVIDDDVFKKLPSYVQEFFECDCKTSIGCLVDYLPPLKDHCPKGGKIKIESVASAKENLSFNNTGMFVLAFGNGSFIAVAPDNTQTVLFDMDVDVDIHVLKNLTFNDWTLKGSVEVFYTKLSAKSDLIGDIDIKILDKLWNFVIKNIAETIANDYLQSGLPLPKLDFVTFSNAKLTFKDQFLRFCTDAVFNFENILK